MQQIIEFFTGLFDTNKWPARWHCGNWTDFHGWLYIVSDIMTWIAYFLIPVYILNYVVKKKTFIRFKKVYLLFATFILLCGTTHLMDVLMFWVPVYRLNALIRFLTGVVSMFTVVKLVQLLPKIFIQKTSIQLEKEIQRRKEVEKRLEEANRNLESFAFVASHDLQEPLRKIGLYSEKLYRNNKNTLDGASIQNIDKIISSSNRLRTMIDDVLTLSSIQNSIVLDVVDLNEAVGKAIADLEIKILEKNAIINLQELPFVKGNEGYLSHLFMNLISNAIKFSKSSPVINISSEQKDGYAFICVEDNGIGMDESELDKIFTTFYRLHSKSAYEGSGIGLAISKRIVHVHGGDIKVKSQLEKGTTFTIKLQLHQSFVSKIQ